MSHSEVKSYQFKHAIKHRVQGLTAAISDEAFLKGASTQALIDAHQYCANVNTILCNELALRGCDPRAAVDLGG